MSKTSIKKPLVAAIGAAVVGSLSATAAVSAENPFAMQELDSGYMQLASSHMEGKCGEGKCGGAKEAVEKSSEGKCGEGKCGGAKEAAEKSSEGKCGEGKCGGSK